MKRNTASEISTQSRVSGGLQSRGTKIAVFSLLFFLFAAAATLSFLPRAQSLATPLIAKGPEAPLGKPDESPQQRAEREFARLAILEPKLFERELRKRKTRQELEAEEIANLAMIEPAAYAAEFARFKTNERIEFELQAREAVLNPELHSGRREDHPLFQEFRIAREGGQEPLESILNPGFQSGNIPGRPELKRPMKIKR
jgi:hypothetical protein